MKGRFARPLFERLTIANAPGPMAPYVAELAVTFLLMAARRVDEHRDALRRPSNAVYARLHTHGAPLDETLRGRTVGLLGLGRIGQETARLLGAFGPRLVAHDPYVPRPVAARLGVRLVGFERLLRESEHLVVAAGLTDETRGVLGREALEHLRDGASVVNVARGGLVDLDALAREVRSGRLRCALDVTDPLEPLPCGTRCAGCGAPSSRRTSARRHGRCGCGWPTACSTPSSASSRGGAWRPGSPPRCWTG